MFFSSSHSHDPRTMEDFYPPSLIGRGGSIVPTTISGTNFALKNHMVQLLRQNCQFHGFKDEDANEHLDKYLSITLFIKQNGVSQDIINLNLFPFSLTHEAESWFYTLKTHSIHTWKEMVFKFLSKYYPYFRALQLRKEIFNFWQLPIESVFKAWERFKSCLRKCLDHKILLLNQILTFYYGITMIDQERLLVAAGDSDESDDDEPSEMIEDQKLIHHLSGSPTPSSDPVVASLSPSFTPTRDSDSILEETDILLPHHDSTSPEVMMINSIRREIFFFLEGLLYDINLGKSPPIEP
ncbi:reverse transcriptase domain-containing protein [Tanacetum coccineum]